MQIMTDRRFKHYSATCSFCNRQILTLNDAVACVALDASDDLATQPILLLHKSPCQTAHAKQARELGAGSFVYCEIKDVAKAMLRLTGGQQALDEAERKLADEAEREAAHRRRVRDRGRTRRRAAKPEVEEPEPPLEAA
jgi:hypothetical protein